MGVGEQISELAGSPSMAGTDMDGRDVEVAEAVTEVVAAHSLYPGVAQHRRQDPTYGTRSSLAPRRTSCSGLCEPGTRVIYTLQRQYHTSTTSTDAVEIPLRTAAVAALSGGVFRKSDLRIRKVTFFSLFADLWRQDESRNGPSLTAVTQCDPHLRLICVIKHLSHHTSRLNDVPVAGVIVGNVIVHTEM